MLADRLHRPVDEFLDLPMYRIRQWIAYITWKQREEEKKNGKS